MKNSLKMQILEEIIAMRQHVRADRREVAKSIFNDEQVITHALADEKQLQLACKGLDVRTAAIKLNEDVFVRHKWLNYLRHQRVSPLHSSLYSH